MLGVGIGLTLTADCFSSVSRNNCFLGDQIRLSSATTLTLVPDELQELPDLTGKVIDNRFRLIKLLHSSAKAAVYAAQDQHLPQNLAVKVFSPQLSAISAYMEQFRREAEAAVCLRHDHIAFLYKLCNF